ncbi:MAG: hypothetical protein HPY65_09385 [Syntrophaceae bacterium]|nr:hypothetical protein [Syntrophaceae bacterium]
MPDQAYHASVIIDDPLLRENYGFLNFRKLLELMDKHNFFTSIAFIPFNYKRTDEKIAYLFRNRPDRFCLCVHGCDHEKGEFGNKDSNYLDMKVTLATARMIEHERRTGIPFERVMVFPQGIFSNAALEVLAKNGYWAAVNTEPLPVDGSLSSSFPFFLRYKPEDVADVICDPIFIVLHHDYFKNGYEKLGVLVDELKSRISTIKWDSVGNIVRSIVTTNPATLNPAGVDLSGREYFGYKEIIKKSARRYASEFRDNYVCKNDYLLNIVKKVRIMISN